MIGTVKYGFILNIFKNGNCLIFINLCPKKLETFKQFLYLDFFENNVKQKLFTFLKSTAYILSCS